MEVSRTALDTGFNGCSSSNARVGCQEIIHSFTRFGFSQEETQGSWPTAMGGVKNGVSVSAEYVPSPGKIDGFALTNVMEEKLNVPLSSRDILVLARLNNGINLEEYRNPSIQGESPFFGSYEPDHYRSGSHTINGRNFNPVVGSPVCSGSLMNEGNPNLRYFPNQVQENSIPPVRNYLLIRAMTPSGSEDLMNLIEKGKHPGIQILLGGILGSMFEWMTQEYACLVFGMLVEKCQYDQLQLIVNRAATEPDRFADAAFTHRGSKSIRKIIKSIKKIPSMEISITRILRPRSYELLTHKVGADVVRQCFLTFGDKPMILFLETLSQRLLDLATDKVGCVSLYTLLDSIKNGYRQLVLEHLADHSLFLTYDPFGNFIVQHLLDLNNKVVTENIITRLEGNFVQLAQRQGASHVTEKCMRHSLKGLKVVISEITKNRNTLFRIARDQFGNYVIQTALKQSKMLTDRKLYMQLLDALRPYYPSLMGKTKGRHVAELIKDDIESTVETNL